MPLLLLQRNIKWLATVTNHRLESARNTAPKDYK